MEQNIGSELASEEDAVKAEGAEVAMGAHAEVVGVGCVGIASSDDAEGGERSCEIQESVFEDLVAGYRDLWSGRRIHRIRMTISDCQSDGRVLG